MPLCRLLAYEVIGARRGNSPCRRTARSWARGCPSGPTCCVCVCVCLGGVEGRGARWVVGSVVGWAWAWAWASMRCGRLSCMLNMGWPCAAAGTATATHVEPTVTTCTAAARLDQTVHPANRTSAHIAPPSWRSLSALTRTRIAPSQPSSTQLPRTPRWGDSTNPPASSPHHPLPLAPPRAPEHRLRRPSPIAGRRCKHRLSAPALPPVSRVAAHRGSCKRPRPKKSSLASPRARMCHET